MPKDLRGLFSPNSVSIIGASSSSEKVGAIALKNIVDSGFKGNIFPVNPKESEIAGLKCYPDISSLPEVPDLAVFAVPSSIVIQVLEEVGKKGIKNAVIFTAGFKEIGPEGEVLQKQLVEMAEKFQINLLGPNCLGFANNNLPINVTFGQVVKEIGNLRIISQSGAIAASLFDWCQTTKLGFSEFVTIGNKAVINENDILDYWASTTTPIIDQPGLSKVSPIGLYLESIANGAEFVKIATAISKTTPIFALKPGKSIAAATAMQSHTGAIAGKDNVLEAALKQSGIIRCQDMGEFFDLARSFAWENAPKGPSVAVVSNAGGPAVLSTDSIEAAGLQMAQFGSITQKKLADTMPRMASFLNPVDVLGDALADRFGQAIEAVLNESSVDAVVVILTPQLMTQIDKTAEIIGKLSAKFSQPILCSFIGGRLASVGENILNEYKIPSFPFPEMAIKTLSLMWQWQSWCDAQNEVIHNQELSTKIDINTVNEIIQSAKDNSQKNLDNFEANRVVVAAGINTPPTTQVSDLNQAKQFADEVGWPVVLKISSPGLLHKADIGGVITKINDVNELSDAGTKLSNQINNIDVEIRKGAKLQIQKDIGSGVEIIVGVKRDPNFGPVMLFGAGGKFAELLGDRNLHLLPINTQSAQKLVSNSKVNTLLKGFRGDQPYNLEKLYETIVRLGKLAESTPDIAEIEINPLIITHDNVWAVDSKIVLVRSNSATRNTTISKLKSATLIDVNKLSENFFHFHFESTDAINFIPGQFISVKISDQKYNSYSIAGSANQNNFELLVDISPQGDGSKLLESLRVGDKIDFIGPAGVFKLLPKDDSKNIIFLGTGSGIAPLKYMIDDALKSKKITQPITLYFGLRYKEDIFWQDHFENLEKAYPNFKFRLCLSKPSSDWTGFAGHITEHIKQDYTNASQCSVYLCGNKDMVLESTNILLELGCPQEKIHSEKYN